MVLKLTEDFMIENFSLSEEKLTINENGISFIYKGISI